MNILELEQELRARKKRTDGRTDIVDKVFNVLSIHVGKAKWKLMLSFAFFG